MQHKIKWTVARAKYIASLKKPPNISKISGHTIKGVVIQPDEAALLLQHVEGIDYRLWKRDISTTHVKHLCKLMHEGVFCFTGQTTIILTPEGVLIDGNHTCQMSVDTGKSFEAIVICGVELNKFPLLDTNRKARSSVDTLRRIGCRTNAQEISAVSKKLYLWDQGFKINRLKVDNHIVQATYLANPTIADSVAATKEFKSLLPLWVVGFLHFIFNREDSEACVEFFHAFAESRYSPDGIQESTDPVWKFRQWLVKTADVEKDNRQRSYHAVYTGINAWNERAVGAEVSDYRKLAYKVGEPIPFLI